MKDLQNLAWLSSTIWRFDYDLTLLDNLRLVTEIHIKEKGLRDQKINKLISQFEFDALLNIKARNYQVVKKSWLLQWLW